MDDGSSATADRFFLEPFAGVVFFDGLKPQPNTGFFEDLRRPAGFVFGMRAGIPLSRSFVLEASISRSATENRHQLIYTDPDPLEGNPTYGLQTLRNSVSPVIRVGGGLVYVIPVRGVILPHLLAGLGWTRVSSRKEVEASIVVPLEDGTVFADTIGVPESNVRLPRQNWLSVDLGCGLSGKVTEVLALRLDLIFHFSRFHPLDVEGPLTGDVYYAKSQRVSDLELSSGVIFRF